MKMLRSALLLGLCGLLIGGALASSAAPAPKRLLVVTHTAGFRHTDGIEAGEKTMQGLADKTHLFTVAYCRTAEDVKTMMTPKALKRYDGVVFLNTTGDLGIPDLPAFLQWVRSGKAVVGMHAATDTYHDQPAFIDMMGGEFETHGHWTTIRPIVNDPRHPAAAGWPAEFTIEDEIYHTKSFSADRVHLILSLDKVPDDGTKTANEPMTFPLAWSKLYGKGRVFYTVFGHPAKTWENPVYQEHILGGIQWALGLAKGEPRPGRK